VFSCYNPFKPFAINTPRPSLISFYVYCRFILQIVRNLFKNLTSSIHLSRSLFRCLRWLQDSSSQGKNQENSLVSKREQSGNFYFHFFHQRDLNFSMLYFKIMLTWARYFANIFFKLGITSVSGCNEKCMSAISLKWSDHLELRRIQTLLTFITSKKDNFEIHPSDPGI